MKLLFHLFAISLLKSAACDNLFVQKCCPERYTFDLKTEKCKRVEGKFVVDWIPDQVKSQNLYRNRTFQILVPTSEEFDMLFDPCPGFLYDVLRPLFITPATQVHLQPEEGASISVNNQIFNQWCFDAVTGTPNSARQWVLLSCPCLHEICVSRCCHSGHRLHINKASAKSLLGMCTNDKKTDWSPLSAKDLDLSKDIVKPWFFRYITIYEFTTSCLYSVHKNYGKTRRPKLIESFRIDSQGTLKSKKYTANHWSYCLAEAEVQGIPKTVAMYCDHTEFVISFDEAFTQSILAGIGAAFTLLTLLIHAAAKDLRQGIKGLSLIAHCTCMLGAYLTMAFRPLAWADENDACTVLGIFTHFFLLSAFYWLNVRAIIIYATFRSWNSMLSGLSLETRSFPLYALYALGVPALISGFMAWAQFANEDDLPYWITWPDLDEAACWFRSPLGRALYFSLPMGIVLIINICLFTITLVKIISFKKENKSILKSDDSSNTVKESLNFDLERLKLFAKLSLLMGLTYVSEFLAWINYLFAYYWYASNVAIALRAVLIFVVFCCRKKVWTSLGTQYPILKRLYNRIAVCFSQCSMTYRRHKQFKAQKLENKDSSTKSTNDGGSKSKPSSSSSRENVEMNKI